MTTVVKDDNIVENFHLNSQFFNHYVNLLPFSFSKLSSELTSSVKTQVVEQKLCFLCIVQY